MQATTSVTISIDRVAIDRNDFRDESCGQTDGLARSALCAFISMHVEQRPNN
jgi:hypothetical protein